METIKEVIEPISLQGVNSSHSFLDINPNEGEKTSVFVDQLEKKTEDYDI